MIDLQKGFDTAISDRSSSLSRLTSSSGSCRRTHQPLPEEPSLRRHMLDWRLFAVRYRLPAHRALFSVPREIASLQIRHITQSQATQPVLICKHFWQCHVLFLHSQAPVAAFYTTSSPQKRDEAAGKGPASSRACLPIGTPSIGSSDHYKNSTAFLCLNLD